MALKIGLTDKKIDSFPHARVEQLCRDGKQLQFAVLHEGRVLETRQEQSVKSEDAYTAIVYHQDDYVFHCLYSQSKDIAEVDASPEIRDLAWTALERDTWQAGHDSALPAKEVADILQAGRSADSYYLVFEKLYAALDSCP